MDDFEASFEDMNIRFDVQIFIVHPDKDNFEILKLRHESKNEISFYRFATWNRRALEVYKSIKRENLNGHFFKTVVNKVSI